MKWAETADQADKVKGTEIHSELSRHELTKDRDFPRAIVNSYSDFNKKYVRVL